MVWRIELSETAGRRLSKVSKADAKRITGFLRDRLASRDDPRSIGTPLKGNRYADLWRYRVGDYRLIAQVRDATLTILIVDLGHRSRIYRR